LEHQVGNQYVVKI